VIAQCPIKPHESRIQVRSYAAEPGKLIEELKRDQVVAEADTYS
jgi:hypothetical protein